MLHNSLSQYLRNIENVIRGLEGTYVERYEEEILTATRVNMRIRLRFLSGFLLELNEAVVVETEQVRHLGYRYHFQDQQNNLVFRYDNTPHFPDLENFPHHKHLENHVTTADEPLILAVIEEARLLAQ